MKLSLLCVYCPRLLAACSCTRRLLSSLGNYESSSLETKEVDKGSSTRSGEEQRIWEVVCHRTGPETTGEEVGDVGTQECQSDTPQLTS